MKNTSLETKLGMFVALVVVAAVVLLEIAGGTDFFKKGYRLHGLFTTAQELKVGDSVKMAGVPIGKVEKIGFEAGKVKVTMKVTEGADVKTDAKATIRFAGLMGQNFVSINLGTPAAPEFKDGDMIQTTEQPDLAAIMQKLENAAGGIEKLGQSFSGQSIENIMGPMMDAFKEATPLIKDTKLTVQDARLSLQEASQTLKEFRTNTIPKFTATLGSLQTVSERMAKGEGSIGKLLTDESLYTETVSTMKALNKSASDAQSLLTDARGAIGDVKLALGDARKTLNTATDTMTTAKQTLTDVRADLQAGKGSLGKLLKDEALYNETTLAMTNLREIMQKINKGQGSVGKFVNDDSLFKNAKMTLQKLDKATEGLEDQGPLSVLGIAVNTLF